MKLGRVIADAALTLAMDVLTGRTQQVALVLALGGGPVAVGALAALAPLGALAQLPGLWLLERVGRRRPVLFGAAVPARAIWILIAAVALLPPSAPRLPLLALLLLARAALAAIGQCAQNAWLRDLLPMAELGSFYATRMRVAEVAGLLASLAGAGVLRLVERAGGLAGLAPNTSGLALLFVLAFALGQSSLWVLSGVPEAPRAPTPPTKIRDALARVARDRDYRQLLALVAVWLLGTTMAGPYLVLFEVRRLGLPLSTLLLLEAIEKGALLLAIGRFGAAIDRQPGARLLGWIAALHAVLLAALPALILVDPGPVRFGLLALLHAGLGIAAGAGALALNTLAFRLAPADQAAAYLAVRSLTMNATTLIAPLLGAALVVGIALPAPLWAGALALAAAALLGRRQR